MIETHSPILAFGIWAAMGMLAGALALASFRLARGPTLPDRVVALDQLSFISVGIVATHTILTGETVLIDVAIIFALISFLGTVGFARYLERAGSEE